MPPRYPRRIVFASEDPTKLRPGEQHPHRSQITWNLRGRSAYILATAKLGKEQKAALAMGAKFYTRLTRLFAEYTVWQISYGSWNACIIRRQATKDIAFRRQHNCACNLCR